MYGRALRQKETNGTIKLFSASHREKAFVFARRLWRMLPKPVRSYFWVRCGSVVCPYQAMIYKGKVLARGRDRTTAYRMLFPSPPTGKTILDVGCHTGFYCLMAASEGAEYCLGIDIEGSRIKKGQALIAREGITNVELAVGDIFRYEPNRLFDIVLCLNLLQHVGTCERADKLLDKLYGLAKAQLVLIVPLTVTPVVTYEFAFYNKIKYLLFSEQYFRNKYGDDCIQFIPLDSSCYGANRAAVIIQTANKIANSGG